MSARSAGKRRKRHSTEEKIRIVLEGLRGEHSIAELCRRDSIAQSLYYKWSKEFLEASKKRLAGDTERQATSGEVKDLRRDMSKLKEALADDDGEQAMSDFRTKRTSPDSPPTVP